MLPVDDHDDNNDDDDYNSHANDWPSFFVIIGLYYIFFYRFIRAKCIFATRSFSPVKSQLLSYRNRFDKG